MKRIATLDLLRGMAAFAVAIPHYLVLASVAPDVAEAISVLGVEVFFVLSGFVLAPQILACVGRQRPGDLGVFLVRRWMRTIPPYLVALIAMSIFANEVVFADFLRYAFYVQNLFAQHNAHDYYPVAWSLSIEEWFYLTFPAILFFSMPWSRASAVRHCVLAAFLFIAAITVARSLFGDAGQWGDEVRRVVVFRIDSIAYGFILYVVARHVDFSRRRVGRKLGALLAFVVATLIAFKAVYAIAMEGSHVSEQLFPFCAAVFGISVILLFSALATELEASSIALRLASYLGKISYSVYLFHLMIGIAVHSALNSAPLIVQLTAYLVSVAALASLFFHYFEKPILAARPQYRRVEASNSWVSRQRVSRRYLNIKPIIGDGGRR